MDIKGKTRAADTLKQAITFGLLTLCTTYANAQPQPTCALAAQRLKVLAADLKGVGGCPPPSAAKAVFESGGPKPTTTCSPNAAAVKAWHRAHDNEFNSLVKQIGLCDVAACPPIPRVTQCRCSPKVNGGNCPCKSSEDLDGDEIPDVFEAQLIARFSPFLRFTLYPMSNGVGVVVLSEQFRPADPITYLSQSRLVGMNNDILAIPQATLVANPRAVLTSTAMGEPSNLLDSFSPDSSFDACVSISPRSSYHLDPINDDVHFGADWNTILQSKHVGLFAHVSKFSPRSVSDLPEQSSQSGGLSKCARRLNGAPDSPVIPLSWYEQSDVTATQVLGLTEKTINCRDCYKIEYYQFFGKNTDWAPANIGDHEGDWSILTVVYDKSSDQMLAASHWAHGYEMRFDLKAPGIQSQEQNDPIVGPQVTYFGLGSVESSFNILKIENAHSAQDQPELAQNNVLTLAKDPVTGKFTHPVAFVEFGAHEFWPSENWGAEGAPPHTGNDKDHSYLTVNIPNLGEVEHPLSDEAAIVLGFSGSWGYVNTLNDPPPGPALHKAWNWYSPNRMPIDCSAAE